MGPGARGAGGRPPTAPRGQADRSTGLPRPTGNSEWTPRVPLLSWVTWGTFAHCCFFNGNMGTAVPPVTYCAHEVCLAPCTPSPAPLYLCQARFPLTLDLEAGERPGRTDLGCRAGTQPLRACGACAFGVFGGGGQAHCRKGFRETQAPGAQPRYQLASLTLTRRARGRATATC